MSKMCTVVVTAILLVGAPSLLLAKEPKTAGPAAEADVQVLLDAIRANRKAMVAVNLNLTDDEATKFWPIYDRYQKELNGVGDRLVAAIQNYATRFTSLSDDEARKGVDDYLAIEADRVKVKQSYLDEFSKALPGRKLARFYQIENKMDAVIKYEIAASIPVIEEAASK